GRGGRARRDPRPGRAAGGRAGRAARRAHPRDHERRAAAHLDGAAQDRAVRHPFDHRGGVARRPGAGDDGAARPHRRHARGQAAAAAQPRRNDHGGVRRAYAAHPRRAQRRRRHRMTSIPTRAIPTKAIRMKAIRFKSFNPNFLLRLVLIAAFLAVWEGIVPLFALPLFILPAPSSIFFALWNGITSWLYVEHVWVTLSETLLGFVLGSALAFAFGISVALSRRVEYFLYPFIVMFQAMPKVALAPLIIIWFGLGLLSKVVSAGLVAFFPLMVNTIVGLRSADEDRINLMRSLAATRGQIFWMLQLPNALPYIFAGLEIAMIFALIGAIVAEFVGAQRGLGMLMQSMNFNMDVAGQFSVLLILSAIGLLLNTIVVEVRRRVL